VEVAFYAFRDFRRSHHDVIIAASLSHRVMPCKHNIAAAAAAAAAAAHSHTPTQSQTDGQTAEVCWHHGMAAQ